MGYCSNEGFIFINGIWQTITKISINSITFEYKDDAKKRIITSISTRDYWKMQHTYEGSPYAH